MAFTSRQNKKHSKSGALYAIIIPLLILFIAFGVIETARISKEKRLILNNFPESVWECNDPYLHLEVGEPWDISGVLRVGEEEHRVCWEGTAGFDAYICEADLYDKLVEEQKFPGSARLLHVYCNCSKDKAVLTIWEDHIFGGRYASITLTRIK